MLPGRGALGIQRPFNTVMLPIMDLILIADDRARILYVGRILLKCSTSDACESADERISEEGLEPCCISWQCCGPLMSFPFSNLLEKGPRRFRQGFRVYDPKGL